MSRLVTHCLIATGLLASTALAAGPAAAGSGLLVPHRAVYDLTMIESNESADVANISGRLVMEFTGSTCTGFTSKLRFVTESEDPDGQSQITNSRSSTFESADGRSLEFANETYTGDILAEESRGKASRKDSDVDVALTKPATKEFALAPSVVFPTEQMQRILDFGFGRSVVPPP